MVVELKAVYSQTQNRFNYEIVWRKKLTKSCFFLLLSSLLFLLNRQLQLQNVFFHLLQLKFGLLVLNSCLRRLHNNLRLLLTSPLSGDHRRRYGWHREENEFKCQQHAYDLNDKPLHVCFGRSDPPFVLLEHLLELVPIGCLLVRFDEEWLRPQKCVTFPKAVSAVRQRFLVPGACVLKWFELLDCFFAFLCYLFSCLVHAHFALFVQIAPFAESSVLGHD